MIRLSKIVKEGEEPKRFSNEVKKHFLEIVSTYNKYQEMMDRKSDITEVAETLGGITDAARELAINEADDWFDAHTVKRNMNELTKLGKSFDQVAIEAKNLDQRLHGLYEDMGHILSRYYKMGEITEDQMKERLGLREAIGNDKAMLALVDMLSNSMEHYASANEFVNITSKIAGFANNKAELRDVFTKYYKVGARERNDWNTKEWLKWLKQWPLEESKTNCVDCGNVNEGKKTFKINPPIGSSKYSISAYDGITKHKDGSPFYNILIFKNKADLERRANYFRGEKYVEEAINEKNPGLWANINAKKARGEKSSPKNSQAYKDAVAAGKQINKEAAYGYKDSTASYIDKHKEEFKAAEKMNKGNEQSFYDSLSTLEEKLGHPKYMIFLSNALRGYKVDMYKDPKIKNQQEAEEALFLLSK